MISPAQWLVAGRVIYAYAEGYSSFAEMRAHSDRLIALLDEGTVPVHIMLENSADYRPEMVDFRSGLDNLSFVRHPSIGWTVQVMQGNHGMRFVARLIARFVRISYQSFDERQDAVEFLRLMDNTVDWTQMDRSILHQEV